MATRFGGVSPSQAYATKARWVIGCLFTIIAFLVALIVFIAQNTDATEKGPETAVAVDPSEGLSPTIEVLVAARRIEEGSMLDQNMLGVTRMDADKTPAAVIRAQDRASIVGKFAKQMINSNVPLVWDDVSETPPLNRIQIPPGYRAVTINVSQRTGVEGYARPNTRVDILWTYKQDGKKKVATIARFIKVISVAGATKVEGARAGVKKKGATTVTLLVTEKDAKKIELARTLGKLTLSLVGAMETSATTTDPDEVTIHDLIGRPAVREDEGETANDGVMYTTDPRSGKQMRYILRNGRWTLDRSFTSPG